MSKLWKFNQYDSDEILCPCGDASEVGCGTFGVVLRGHHKRVGQVAIKCFEVQGGPQEKSLLIQEVKGEIETLMRANHVSIVQVYGWSKWPQSVGIVMEYLSGGNLRCLLLNQRVDLAWILRLRMAGEMAGGVAFIHNLTETERLTHGDLKPENILLTEDLHCKIGDFGSAKVSRYTSSSFPNNNVTNPKFTKVYAAPERLQRSSWPMKKELDTYSFGLILHMLLIRVLPYEGDPEMFVENVKQGLRPSCALIEVLKEKAANDAERKIISLLKKIMKICWSQNPEERCEMTAARDALQQHPTEEQKREIPASVHRAKQQMTSSLFGPSSHPMIPLSSYLTHQRRFLDIGIRGQLLCSNVTRSRSSSFHPTNDNGETSPDMLERSQSCFVQNSPSFLPGETRPKILGGFTTPTDGFPPPSNDPSEVPEIETAEARGIVEASLSIRHNPSTDGERPTAEPVAHVVGACGGNDAIELASDLSNSQQEPRDEYNGPAETSVAPKVDENPVKRCTGASNQDTPVPKPRRSLLPAQHQTTNEDGRITSSVPVHLPHDIIDTHTGNPDDKNQQTTEPLGSSSEKTAIEDICEGEPEPIATAASSSEAGGTSSVSRQVTGSAPEETASSEDIELFLGSDEKTRILGEKYKIRIRNKSNVKTEEIALEMVELLNRENMSVAWAVKDVAFHLANDGRFVMSILCYHTSILMYKQEDASRKSLSSLESCAVGLKQASDQMITQSINFDEMVKSHVIPLLGDVRTWISCLATTDARDECLVTYLDCIQHCQGIVGDVDSQIETLTEGIAFQKKKYGSTGKTRNTHDESYYLVSRYHDAARCLKEVFDSFQTSKEQRSASASSDGHTALPASRRAVESNFQPMPPVTPSPITVSMPTTKDRCPTPTFHYDSQPGDQSNSGSMSASNHSYEDIYEEPPGFRTKLNETNAAQWTPASTKRCEKPMGVKSKKRPYKLVKKVFKKQSSSKDDQGPSRPLHQQPEFVIASEKLKKRKVVLSYQANDSDKLTISPGDIIEVIEEYGSGWGLGKLGGKTGYFPLNYTKAITGADDIPSPRSHIKNKCEKQILYKCKVLFDHTPGEQDELTINYGDILEVVAEYGGWSLGRLNGKEGLFPSNFTEKISDGKDETLHKEHQEKTDLMSTRASELLQQYTSQLSRHQYTESEKNRAAIDDFVRTQNMEPEFLEKQAFKCCKNGLFPKSAAVYYVAAISYTQQRSQNLAIDGIASCAWGLRELCEASLTESTSERKHMIKYHVIPLMRDIQCQIQHMKSVKEQVRHINEAWCLHYIEYSEGLIGDINARDATLQEAVRLLEATFQSNAVKYQLYGHCLNNLASTKLQRRANADAVKFFQQAIDAYKKAIDFENEAQQMKDIEMCKVNLKKVKKYFKK